MSVELAGIDVAAFAFAVAERADVNAWLGVVVTESRQEEITARLKDAISSVSDFHIHVLRAPEVRHLARELAQKPQQIVLLWDLEHLSSADWNHLDEERSRLAHRSQIVLVLTQGAAENLIRHAPNLASWLGSIYRIEPDAKAVTADEVQKRVDVLSAHYGFSARS